MLPFFINYKNMIYSFSLNPAINTATFDRLINPPRRHARVYDDLCYSTLTLGEVTPGTYYVSVNEGIISSATKEEVYFTPPYCEFESMVFNIIENSSVANVVVSLHGGGKTIVTSTVNPEATGEFITSGSNQYVGDLYKKIVVIDGTVDFGEIVTTYGTDPN